MASITELPCELFILINVLCPDVQTAIRLSLSDRKLRRVWLDNHEHVVKMILDIPAYEDAIDLAKNEVLISNEDGGTRLQQQAKLRIPLSLIQLKHHNHLTFGYHV